MWKILGCLLGIIVLFAMAGYSGLLFHMWPTFWPDATLQATALDVEQLKTLRDQPKFGSMHGIPGARNEAVRLTQEAQVNAVVDILIENIQAHPKKSYVLGVMKNALKDTSGFDDEEKDQLVEYFNQIIDVLDMDGSNELFNVWRHGFPYGWVMPPPQKP